MTWITVPMSQLASNTTPVVYEAAEAPVAISIFFGKGAEERVYRDGRFLPQYLGSSKEDLTFTLVRAGGWPTVLTDDVPPQRFPMEVFVDDSASAPGGEDSHDAHFIWGRPIHNVGENDSEPGESWVLSYSGYDNRWEYHPRVELRVLSSSDTTVKVVRDIWDLSVAHYYYDTEAGIALGKTYNYTIQDPTYSASGENGLDIYGNLVHKHYDTGGKANLKPIKLNSPGHIQRPGVGIQDWVEINTPYGWIELTWSPHTDPAKRRWIVTGEGVGPVDSGGETVTSLSMAGDVTGTTDAANVSKIQGHPVSNWEPEPGQVLQYSGDYSMWLPTTLSGGGTTLSGDVTGAAASTTVAKIQGRAVASTAPANGNVLAWNAGAGAWGPSAPSAGGTSHKLTSGSSSSAIAGPGSNWTKFSTLLTWSNDVPHVDMPYANGIWTLNQAGYYTFSATFNRGSSATAGYIGYRLVENSEGIIAGKSVFWVPVNDTGTCTWTWNFYASQYQQYVLELCKSSNITIGTFATNGTLGGETVPTASISLLYLGA